MNKKALGCILSPVLLMSALLVVLATCHHTLAGRRARWKSEALPRLAALSITNQEISAELSALRDEITQNDGWIGENVLLMTNGQHLIYAFRHGANEGWPHHLFLARGSDGRWFYSSYHFCNSMGMVRGDAPPGSIDEFVTRYEVREFDGVSDDCLKTTWPRRE